jgi:hypothetical protein
MKATHILVAQAGWVFVGTLAKGLVSSVVVLDKAACVRKWGTTRGLGELALSGPTKETMLDPCGTVELPLASVLFTIPVNPEKWSK